MQIQPPNSAANAAANAAQAPNKDASPTVSGNAAKGLSPTNVEQSGKSSADRDAQGQGDGLADRGGGQAGTEAEADPEDAPPPAPNLPGEPPSQLDVMG